MNTQVALACERTVKEIEIKRILPLRKIAPGTQKSVKYRRIATSIREVGIIEPLVIYPQKNDDDVYILLDGHIRLDILKESKQQSVDCLIALDDEAFTYNHKVNRLSAIQEHFMLMQAVKNGVSEQTIAAALNVDVSKIREKQNLLVGICPEAVQLLRGKRSTAGSLRQLRKVKPMRQIEMAELMCASNNYSVGYAKCLLAATPPDQLVEQDNSKEVGGLAAADMARMEREMEAIGQDFRRIEETHGKNVLNLVIVVGYVKKLIDNARVVRFLAQDHPELLTEFQKMAESRTLTDIPSEE
jgi:RepB plasmid partitioning protein/ParB/Sulfiredoxin domain